RDKQIGEQIRTDGPQSHKKKAGTPTMGGSLILFALGIPTVLWCDLTNRFVWLTLGVTIGYGIVGFIDDYFKLTRGKRGLPGKIKFAWKMIIAAAAVSYIFYSDIYDPEIKARLALPLFDFHKFPISLPIILYVVLGIFVVVGASNAVNMTDGLDGLAIGP